MQGGTLTLPAFPQAFLQPVELFQGCLSFLLRCLSHGNHILVVLYNLCVLPAQLALTSVVVKECLFHFARSKGMV